MAYRVSAKLAGAGGSACCCETPGTLECRVKGGTATICGWDEYVPSVPAKKYRLRTRSGSLVITHKISDNCTGTTECTETLTFGDSCYKPGCSFGGGSGSSTYDGGCGGDPYENVGCADVTEVAESGQVTVTKTATTRTATGNSSCSSTDSFHSRFTSGEQVSTLSEEDTEEDAIDRLLAATDWGSWTPSGSAEGQCAPSTCCKTIWTVRSAEVFSFSFQGAEGKASWAPGTLRPGWPHTIILDVFSRAVGGSSWTLTGTLEFTSTPDGFGGDVLTFDIPSDRGFEHYVANPRAIENP